MQGSNVWIDTGGLSFYLASEHRADGRRTWDKDETTARHGLKECRLRFKNVDKTGDFYQIGASSR